MHTTKNSFKTVMVRLGTIAAAILLGGSLLLTHSSSLADDTQQDAAFTCASAVNVMDCISQTGTGAVKQSDVTSIPINSQALGFTGPVSVGLRYDNYLAWIMDVGYAQSFYNAAAAFKLSAGLNERRANVTLGYSITPKQQIKLTYEYLAQNLPFDYSTGTVNEWVNQNAFGAAYRYMLDYGIVRALEVYGNYTKANSKDLSDIEMYTDSQLTAIDQRRIAGGTQQNYGAAVTLTPFENTIVKVGGGYSTLSFNTEWSDPQKQSAIAYDAELSRLLTPKTMVSAGIGNTAAGQTYTAKVSRILPWSLEGALTGQYMATTNDIPGSTSVTASLSYPAPKTYTNMFAAGIGNLKDWVQQPVIYNTRVLAKAEERKIAAGITAAKIPPVDVSINAKMPAIKTNALFSFNPGVYEKITYTPTSITIGQNPANTTLNLSVQYTDSLNAIITMSNPTTQDMIPNGQPVTYTVNLEADGYRGQNIVTKTQSSFNITVTQDSGIKAANWSSNTTLPTATPNSVYNNGTQIPLINYVTPSIPGEDFTFDYATNDHPNWINLVDHKYLVGDANNKVPNTTDPKATIILKATSLASGHVANPENQTLTIPISSIATPPNWVDNLSLPVATQEAVYTPQGSTTGYDLNPYSPTPAGFTTPDEINKQPIQPTPSPNTVTFQMHNPQDTDDCKWLKIVNGRYLISDGPVPADATDCWVNVDVTSTNVPKNPTNMLPKPKITVIKTVIILPDWINPAVQGVLPDANVGMNYSLPNNKVLDPYAANTAGYLSQTTKNKQIVYPPDENITFQKTPDADSKASPCTWLKVTEKTLESNGPVTGSDCYAYIDVISKQNNNVPYSLNAKLIKVTSSAPFQPFWQSGSSIIKVAYNSSPNINLNTAVGSNLASDNLSFSQGTPWNCNWLSIPNTGIPYYLTGKAPNVVSQDCTITLSVSSSVAPGSSPQPLGATIHFIPDTSQGFAPTPTNFTLDDALIGQGYDSNVALDTIVKSNRVGEDLNTPFKASSQKCNDPNDPTPPSFVVDQNNNHLKTNGIVSNTTTSTSCDVTIHVISSYDSSFNADVTATIKIKPNTNVDLKPTFNNGSPLPAMYHQNYQTQNLADIITSNRPGEKLQGFTKNTANGAWTCNWLDVVDQKLQQINPPQYPTDSSPCHISVTAQSQTNSDTGNADEDITISPDTITPFQPDFIPGTPPDATYTVPYPANTADLSTMIFSNRQGDSIKAFTNFSSPNCSWLTLASDGKTLTGTPPAPATYTGDTTCQVNVSATSSADNTTQPVPGRTLTIKPDLNDNFAPSLLSNPPNTKFGDNSYSLDLNSIIRSNRPGEPLATPFVIDNNASTCKDDDGTPWFKVDASNRLVSNKPIPIASKTYHSDTQSNSCNVTLSVTGGYDHYTNTPPNAPVNLPITIDKNNEITPTWVNSTDCPTPIITNASKSGTPTTLDLRKCIQNIYQGQPISDDTISFSGSQGFATITTGYQLNATPTIRDLGTNLTLPMTVSSQAYTNNKQVSQNLNVQYYIINNTNLGFSSYGATSSVAYISGVNEFITGTYYKVASYTGSVDYIYACNQSGSEGSKGDQTPVSQPPSWNPDYQSHPTCWWSHDPAAPSGEFTNGSDSKASIVFTKQNTQNNPSVTSIKIVKSR